MLQHHKIEEKITNAHPEQTPPRAKGERPGILELHLRGCLCPTTNRAGRREEFSTELTCRVKEKGGRRKENGGGEPACLLQGPNRLLAALNSSVWDCQHSRYWIIPAKMSIMRIYPSAGEGQSKPIPGKTALLQSHFFTRKNICSPRQEAIPDKKAHNERSRKIYPVFGSPPISFPTGRTHCKNLQKDSGVCHGKQHGRPRVSAG